MARPPRDIPDADLEIFAKRLAADRTPVEAGKIGFSGVAIDDVKSVLPSAFRFHPEIPRLSRRAIVSEACFALAQRSTMTGTALRSTIDRLQRDYLRKEKRLFILTSTVSIPKRQAPSSRTIKGGRVRFFQVLPKRLRRAETDELRDRIGLPDAPRDFAALTVEVRARSAADAFEQAIWRVDLLRAMWNLAHNTRTISRWSTGQTPVNEIRMGPLSVLHTADGTVVPGSLWGEPPWTYSEIAARLGGRWTTVLKDEAWIRRALRRIQYRESIQDLLVRYTRALDGRDYESTHVKLWSVLEQATGTADARYDVTVRRASFLWKDWEHARVVLEGHRRVRNETVHAGSGPEVWEGHLYSLKRFVERLIWFHLQAGTRFSTFAEACNFLELPPSLPDLGRKLELLRWALRMRR